MSLDVSIDGSAPQWGQLLVRSINRALDSRKWPFISKSTYTVAQLTGAGGAILAAQYPYKFAIVSNGAGNKHVAQSSGTAFYYLDGTAV